MQATIKELSNLADIAKRSNLARVDEVEISAKKIKRFIEDQSLQIKILNLKEKEKSGFTVNPKAKDQVGSIIADCMIYAQKNNDSSVSAKERFYNNAVVLTAAVENILSAINES